MTLWLPHLRTRPSGGGLIVPVLAVLGAELTRAIALRAFAERVRDFAVPVTDRARVKIAIASITGSHHELPTGGDTFLAQHA
jgi:hypothetical protein